MDRIVSARKLLEVPAKQLWNMLTGNFKLRFDDGVIETNAHEVIYSSYLWDFHREFRLTPLLTTHHSAHIVQDKFLNAKTHLALFRIIYNDAYDAYRSSNQLLAMGIDDYELRDRLGRAMYVINNRMYNDMSVGTLRYTTAIDVLDFLEVLDAPELIEAKKGKIETYNDVEAIYDVARKVIRSPAFDNNSLARAYRCGVVKEDQIHQMIAPRGGVTDLDGENPIIVTSSFVEGLTKLHESFVETRSASKHLASSKGAISSTEFFSRKLQFVTHIVKNLHLGDCGSTKYVHFPVKGEIIENGVLIRNNDLKLIAGLNYFDDETQTLKTVRTTDRHLLGKTIKLRSVVHCNHPDDYGVCSTCFGQLSYAIPKNTNLGHICGTHFTAKINQGVLSTKHLLGNAFIERVYLDNFTEQYLTVGEDGCSLLISDKSKNKKVRLLVPSEGCPNITDIYHVDSVADLSVSRVSEFHEIGLEITEGEVTKIISLDVTKERRLSSFTYELLDYIRVHGYGTEENLTVIDMCDWDWNKPILSLPLKNYTMSDFGKDVATMLESSMENIKKRDRKVSPDAYLIEVFDFINTRLTVPLALIQVVLYGYMVEDAEAGYFNLPKGDSKREMSVLSELMSRRSLGVAFAYQGHSNLIASPESYNDHRPDHPFDELFLPEQVVGHL